LEIIKKQHSIKLPPAGFIMNYTSKIKTEAVMRLGVYSLGKWVKRIFRRPVPDNRAEEIRALKHGLARIKIDMERTVVFHFKSYRENIKFQYVFKLMEAVEESFYREIMDRFQVYNADISLLRDAVSEKRIDKEHLSEILNKTKQVAADIRDGICQLAENIESIEAGLENQQEKNKQEA